MEAPPQGVPDDIAALLGTDDVELHPDAALDATPEGQDYASFLDDLSLGDAGEADAGAAPIPGRAAKDEEAPIDDFELPGGFREEGPKAPEDDFSVPESLLAGLDSFGESGEESADPPDDLEALEGIEPTEPLDVLAEPIAEPIAEPSAETAGLDDFAIPESLLEGVGDMDPSPEPDLDAATDAVPEAEGVGVPDEVEAIDSFGLDDLAALSSEPSAADGIPQDEFSMPDSGEPSPPPLGDDALAMDLASPVAGDDAFSVGLDSPAAGDDAFAIPEELSDEAEPGPERAPIDSGFDLGSESAEGDSFDQFDLGGSTQDATVPELGADDFAKGMGSDDLDGQLANLDGSAPAADNFAIDSDWGGDFTIPGFEMGAEAKPAAGPKTAKAASGGSLAGAFGPDASKPRAEKQARPVDLSDEQADALQDTLLSYPLNLRLAVEDIVANGKGTEAQQSDLVWLLVEGAQAKDAAKLAGRILKRYIEVPTSFAKRTGAAFEAEKGSFRYIFFHSILPALQVLLLVAAGAGAVFYLGYTFAYRPLKANSLYAEGHKQIGLAKYGESLELFERALKEWSMKGWHYRYAEAYADSDQYPRAEAMYERLLRQWPKETKAALQYATMELEILSFAKTESILQRYILGRDYFNKQALILSAENFLSWADFEEQDYSGPSPEVDGLYEKARLQLATLMERHGRSDEYLELMLLYFIRTEHASGDDKIKEILPLTRYFVSNKKSGWSSATLAELGEYLLDRDETEHVSAVLLSAVDRDGSLPEAHAAMARWNRRAGFPADELRALEYAARFFAEAEARSGLAPKRVRRYLEAMMRLGELRKADGRSLDAEDAFNVAIDRYERALASRQLKADPRYGRAYSLLADIYYAERIDFPGALALYSKAEENGYTSPATDYRRGYMHYVNGEGDGSAALRYFYRAGLDTDVSPYLQWATANALYARDDYFAAQGYYSMLAKRLEFELDTLSLPSPQTKPSHGELVELLMMTKNNLGAAQYRVAERMGDARRRADAMVEFTESARLFDSLVRDQKSMIRPDAKNLGFLNLDFVLHPLRGIDLGIYKTIPTEMAYPRK